MYKACVEDLVGKTLNELLVDLQTASDNTVTQLLTCFKNSHNLLRQRLNTLMCHKK